MIWHTLTWTFWVTAATGSMLYIAGAIHALDVAWHWSPKRADMAQLHRERRAETAALLGRWALGCLTAAATLGLVGICWVWHRAIPGAMCGTGVLQAMGTSGSRAIVFWSVALLMLYGWRVLDRLDSHHPEAVLTQTAARVMLATAPLLALALFYAWPALMRMDAIPSVSCCATVYDQVLNRPSASASSARLVSLALWGSLIGSVVLLVWMVLKIRLTDLRFGILPALIIVLWVSAAAVSVKQVWSAYYYQVLSHPCPWCLFLPQHDAVGFLIFGCMALVVMDGVALWLADRVRTRHAVLSDPAGRQIRRSALRMIICLIAYTALTAGPALAWRIRSGVWLDGSG